MQEGSPPPPDRPASVGFAVMSASAVGQGDALNQPATHTAAAAPKTAMKARTPVVINAGDRVKMYSGLHPGQRQHEVTLLKVSRQILLPLGKAQATLAIKCP